MATYSGVFFLIYQNITLIDFAYVWNEKWLKKYEDGTVFYGILLILASIGLLCLTVISMLFNIGKFWIEGCGYYKTNLIFEVIIILGLLVLTLTQLYRSSSVMTTLFVCLVYSYFNGYSLDSFYDKSCNPNKELKQNIYYSVIHICANVGAGFLTILCLSFDFESSDKISGAGLGYKLVGAEQADTQPMLVQADEGDFSKIDPVYQGNYYVWFHFIMIIFSMYIVMIFFDWRELNIEVEEWSELLSPSPSAFFIKTICNFSFVLLYTWTLIAPAILKDREFD